MKIQIIALIICICFISAVQSQDDKAASIKRGENLYMGYCATCHMADGAGIEGVFPPLAESDFLMADKRRSISITKFGLEGEIVVNGTTYNNIMTPLGLSDQEIADVLNFIRNSWGNEGEVVTTKEVSEVTE